MQCSLLVFLGLSGSGQHDEIPAGGGHGKEKKADEGILEFGARVWDTWAAKAIDIWKLSHGNDGSFAAGEREQLAMERRAIMHKDTGANQAKNFQKVADDALFYLCYGNDVRLLGRFSRARQGFGQGGGLARAPL